MKKEEPKQKWPPLACFKLQQKLRDAHKGTHRDSVENACKITGLPREEYEARVQLGAQEFGKLMAQWGETGKLPNNPIFRMMALEDKLQKPFAASPAKTEKNKQAQPPTQENER